MKILIVKVIFDSPIIYTAKPLFMNSQSHFKKRVQKLVCSLSAPLHLEQYNVSHHLFSANWRQWMKASWTPKTFPPLLNWHWTSIPSVKPVFVHWHYDVASTACIYILVGANFCIILWKGQMVLCVWVFWIVWATDRQLVVARVHIIIIIMGGVGGR